MAADDKASDERHQSRSLERDRDKHRRRQRSASPQPLKQSRKRSRSPDVEEKHRYKDSAEKHEDSTDRELSFRKTGGMSEEDNGKEVARKTGVKVDEKLGARKSSKESRKVELHSSGDSSEVPCSDSESDRGRKKKSRSKTHKSRKSKSKHHRHVRSESEQDESQTEGTVGENSEDSEDEYRRAKRRKRLKPKQKAERERKEERRRKKERKRKMKEKDREQKRRNTKTKQVVKQANCRITESCDHYGIITELDMRKRKFEFSVWLAEVKKVNLATLTNREEEDMFKQYTEDNNMVTFPSKKCYNIDRYHQRKVTKQRLKDTKDMPPKQSERTEFDDEQRRHGIPPERPKMKETELVQSQLTMMETGMGKVMRDEVVLREEMQYPYLLGNTEVCNEEKDHDVQYCIEDDIVHGESSNKDPILDPKHKIFLSHSGAEKEFVDHLCKALEDRWHYPFFDRRHESLPKGERFAELIVQAARQCEMLIVVVSNEYFMSKWPMIELSAFVKAHKLHLGSKSGPKILPLFYRLSVLDLDDEGMQKKWIQQWKTLAKADPKKRIVVSDWKNALEVLRSFNGLSYDSSLKEVVAFIDKIVSNVCKSIVPDIKWDDSHVQGKSSICKVIGEKIEGIGVSQKYQVKVLGIHGVGGIGKTTTCQTLCSELSSKYEGRVCHIEFPSVPLSDSKELFHKILHDLTRKSMEVIQPLNEGECKDILRKSLFKQRTFLALDNISDSHQSIEKAKMFLEFPYHKESLVVVTARSSSILGLLGLGGDACLEMPDLGEVDAMSLFLHHAIGGKQILKDVEILDVMTCVRRCYFSKGNGVDYHYHPLALKSLGLQLSCCGENPCDWVKHLPRVRAFNFLPGGNPVFDILRSSFDLLPPRDQALFMDVGCFSKIGFDGFRFSHLIEWLCFVHKQDEEEIAFRLEHLRRKGLLQDVDLRCGRISIHDLYWEFAKLEAKGCFNESTNFKERMWVYIENGDISALECRPKGGFWQKLLRLSIVDKHLDLDDSEENFGRVEGIEGLKWDHFSNVQVLQLFGLRCRHGALNLVGLVCLRVLELYEVSGIDRIEGLEQLKHLAYFAWTTGWTPSLSGMVAPIAGLLPSSLKIFRICGEVGLESNLLTRCSILSELHLVGVEACSLDLSKCWSLESILILGAGKLQTLWVPIACQQSNLECLEIGGCKDLVDIPGIDQLSGLKILDVYECDKWEVPSFLALTKLQELDISGVQGLLLRANDYFPCQLQKLSWRQSPYSQELNLSGFNQLESLFLSWRIDLTSLAELGDLPALRCLDLLGCEHLLRLPNLSMSRNLEELNLEGCSALELHENDIQMLSELPFLEPVNFSRMEEQGKFRLDLTQRKVLVYSRVYRAPEWQHWRLGDWKEQDLGTPPIKIGRRGTWELVREDNICLEFQLRVCRFLLETQPSQGLFQMSL